MTYTVHKSRNRWVKVFQGLKDTQANMIDLKWGQGKPIDGSIVQNAQINCSPLSGVEHATNVVGDGASSEFNLSALGVVKVYCLANFMIVNGSMALELVGSVFLEWNFASSDVKTFIF